MHFFKLWEGCGAKYRGRGGLLLVIGDWAAFLLVIWWFAPKKLGDLVILRSCGDGDLAIIMLVIWWLVPQKIGDLVIFRSYGDGDLPIFWWLEYVWI